MPSRPPSFRRLVLGLQPSASDRSVHFAVEMANLLRLDLLGLFLDDNSIRDLARIPFAREFRGPGVGWRPIEIESVTRELEIVAGSLKRMFEAAVSRLETQGRFAVASGSLQEAIPAMLGAEDILMLVEPMSPAELLTSQHAWLSETAFRSVAAVLVVPSRIVRRTGSIVAIAAMPDDPSIHAAAAIAIAANEELVIVEADHHGLESDLARQVGNETALKVSRIASPKSVFPNPATCAQAFRHLQERLVVMTRGAFDDSVASVIASARQVPVLIIEPPR